MKKDTPAERLEQLLIWLYCGELTTLQQQELAILLHDEHHRNSKPVLVMARDWMLNVRADQKTLKVHVSFKHPGLGQHSEGVYTIQNLVNGINLNVGTCMNVAMGLLTEEAPPKC